MPVFAAAAAAAAAAPTASTTTAAAAALGEDVPFSELALARPVGEGAFGRVYLALWRETAVAVKLLAPRPAEEWDAAPPAPPLLPGPPGDGGNGGEAGAFPALWRLPAAWPAARGPVRVLHRR